MSSWKVKSQVFNFRVYVMERSRIAFTSIRMELGTMSTVRSRVDLFAQDHHLKQARFRLKFVPIISVLMLSRIWQLCYIYFLENFCTPNSCQNGGKCDNNIDDSGHECICSGPFTGENCQTSTYQSKHFYHLYQQYLKNNVCF